MKAARLIAHGRPGRFEIVEVPDPAPAPGEALVEVRCCGLNRLDLWVEEAGLPVPITLPRTPGGEISGVIAAVGNGVDQWQPGDRVAVQNNIYCGHCEYCQAGEESRCLRGELLGVQRDGGFAEKVAVPVGTLNRLPPAVDFNTSAALTLAGSTAMRMVATRARVEPGQWVLVIAGASGVGSAAIQIARGLGAHVVATAGTEAKRALALRLGAAAAVDSSDPAWPAAVRKATGKRGVDVVIEHVGGEVLAKAFDCLARNGAVVTCGATAGRDVQFNLWPFFVKEHRLLGSYGRNRADLAATLDWAADGRLRPVVDSVFPLDQLPAAFEKLRSREVLGKILVAPKP